MASQHLEAPKGRSLDEDAPWFFETQKFDFPGGTTALSIGCILFAKIRYLEKKAVSCISCFNKRTVSNSLRYISSRLI